MADYDISFVEWAAYGVPIALILIPLAWLIITRVFPPVELERERFRKFVEDSRVTEKVDRQEAKVICIMGTMIVLWILSSWIPAINLYVVAVLGVAVMFLPGVQVLDWENFKKNTNFQMTDMPKATAPILLALALLCTLWNPLLCGWMA